MLSMAGQRLEDQIGKREPKTAFDQSRPVSGQPWGFYNQSTAAQTPFEPFIQT